jgi:soluble lytic murein transglycosylase-like protein
VRSVLASLVLAAVAAVALPTWGGPAVVFSDGRTMPVERAERRDDTAFLYLEGGGALAIPAERVVNWEELSRIEDAPSPRAGKAGASRRDHDPSWRLAAGAYADLIGRMAERHDLDPALLTAVAQVESAFDPLAVSPQGARGLLQLMPDTAERFGVGDPFDVAQNIDGGARYLSWLLARYDGRTDLALAGYNAGEGAVDRHGGIPPYRETHHYVYRVLNGVEQLDDLAP